MGETPCSANRMHGVSEPNTYGEASGWGRFEFAGRANKDTSGFSTQQTVGRCQY